MDVFYKVVELCNQLFVDVGVVVVYGFVVQEVMFDLCLVFGLFGVLVVVQFGEFQQVFFGFGGQQL